MQTNLVDKRDRYKATNKTVQMTWSKEWKKKSRNKNSFSTAEDILAVGEKNVCPQSTTASYLKNRKTQFMRIII